MDTIMPNSGVRTSPINSRSINGVFTYSGTVIQTVPTSADIQAMVGGGYLDGRQFRYDDPYALLADNQFYDLRSEPGVVSITVDSGNKFYQTITLSGMVGITTDSGNKFIQLNSISGMVNITGR